LVLVYREKSEYVLNMKVEHCKQTGPPLSPFSLFVHEFCPFLGRDLTDNILRISDVGKHIQEFLNSVLGPKTASIIAFFH
jgi:hypothetical protein